VAILLAQNRERLERWYRIVTPPWDTTRHVIHKDLTYAAAREVGVDTPRAYGEATLETAARADVVFPVVVKPVESRPFVVRFGVKLFVARDRAELRRHVGDVQAAGLRAQIIDLVPGPDELFYSYTVYIDRRGEPVAELCMRKLRKSPPFFGVVRVAEVATRSELREPTIALLRRIGWRGMASVEYKLDPRDQRYRLMEINGRSFLIQGLAWRAGVNYPLLGWRESVLGENVAARYNGWKGVWVHLLDDLYYALFHRAVEGVAIREYLAPYRRPQIHAVWSPTDPRPFLMQGYNALRQAAAASLDAGVRATLRSHVQGIPVGSGHPEP
jgi:predicted ATP-grasp superfamily ATP-dependent carboligase